MNAISKRLLSWLCVIAMVLSFVPVMDLSGWAVTTKAAGETGSEASNTTDTTEVAEAIDWSKYGSANLEGIDPEIIEKMDKGNAIDNSDEYIYNITENTESELYGTCPMCGATGITWDRKTNGFAFNDQEGKTAHIYFDSEFTTSNNLLQMVNYPADNDLDSKDGTLCVALKSTANITCSQYRIQMGGTNNVLNIMGTGKVTADQSKSEWEKGDMGLFQVK